MACFVEEIDRSQHSLFPAFLDDYVAEDNPVRAIDAFADGLDLDKLGFTRVEPLVTGRPGYHPATLLYIYGYLNRIPSSRRLERECQRNSTTQSSAYLSAGRGVSTAICGYPCVNVQILFIRTADVRLRVVAVCLIESSAVARRCRVALAESYRKPPNCSTLYSPIRAIDSTSRCHESHEPIRPDQVRATCPRNTSGR